MNAHKLLADLAASVFGFCSALLHDRLNPRFAQPVFGQSTEADILASAAVLLATLIVHILAALLIRNRAKAAQQDQKDTKQHFFRASTKPLYLFLWSFGFYFAVVPLLPKLPAYAATARNLLDKLLDLGICIALLWFFIRLTWLLEARLAGWSHKTKTRLDDLLIPLVGRVLRILIPVVGLIFVLPILDLPARYAEAVAKGSSILIILTLATILFETVNVGEKVLLSERDLTAADNLQARKIYTQVKLLGKAIHVAIGLCTVATILMLFQQVRHVGTSLLASAGIAGIIAGIAAQQTLANLFAGFQIALAQPIRQDDVVIVEGEWGRIEEITLTYVVVHVWDDTRLVLPLSYFIQKPFQNWTRSSARLLGSIFVWVDYTFPVEDGRQALKSIIENNPLWDKRFWNLQVSDASEKTMQLRVLATAADSSKAWDLRCKIREDFIAYIQRSHPQCLPRVRADITSPNTLRQPAISEEFS
ncbi:MAG TPA: mechanosensitive ion channel domain-containing protein [Candidatus Acidoferrales bacterium]|nr:mechanosensitive ion channel domain-containing protein [Candidatus Acidoferrales bacterium]